MKINSSQPDGSQQEDVNADSDLQERFSAIRGKSTDAEAWIEQAEVDYARGNWAEAIASCEKAVSCQPHWAPAYVTWGNALQASGKIEEAIRLYSQALELDRNLPQAHANLGSMFFHQGRLDEAIASYQKAASLQPDLAAVSWNLAKVLWRQGKFEEARASEEKALQLNPQLGGAEFHLNRGRNFSRIGNLDAAISAWQIAIKLQPDLVEAYCNIGIILRSKSKFKEAIHYLEKAIGFQPDYATAHQHLCGIIRDSGNYAAAREAVNKYSQNCGQTDPIMTAIYSISTYQVSGLNEIAKDRFLEIESKLSHDFVVVKKDVEFKSLYGNFLFMAPYLRDDIAANSQLCKLVAKEYRDRLLKPNPSLKQLPTTLANLNNRKLRIGFLSNHFKRHSVGWCSADIILELSQLKAEIYLYTNEPLKIDDLTNKIGGGTTKLYRPEKYPNGQADVEEIVAEMRQDAIDILVDLDSLTVPIHAEILYRQPAPCCISWLGFEAPYISENNYFLGDRHTHPADREKYYTEKLLRMPDSFVAVSGFQRKAMEREALRKSHRIGLDQIVYLSIATGKKFNRDLAQAQVAILKQVPNSILIHKGNGDMEVFRAAYHQACETEGVSIHRIKFFKPVPTEEEHRLIYSVADIILDSYPYNGGTHSLEALWFNLPMVTRTGEQFLSRMGYSFLQTLGIEAGISRSREDYINWGVKLGNDASLRQEIVEYLAKTKEPEHLSPLWNPKKFANNMYDLLVGILTKNGDKAGTKN